MTILVFGRNGQVATELQHQAKVVALGRDQANLEDPSNCAAIIAAEKPTMVINAAAYTKVDAAEDDEDLATLINGEAPTEMAKVCAQLGIPFLHISTDYVFDGSVGPAWKPNDQTAPINAYGRSKLVGEQGILDAGGQQIILRTAWVFSAHGNNFVKTMLRLAETRNELGIVGDQTGGPTSARRIAAVLLSISSKIDQGNKNHGVYHYSGTPPATWADFAREIFHLGGKEMTVNDLSTSEYPTPAKRPANSVLDCTSLKADFGISQPDWRSDLDETLKDLGAHAK